MLTVAEAAEKLGVCRQRVDQLIREKKLPAIFIGRQRFIPQDELKKVTVHGKAGRPKSQQVARSAKAAG